MSTHPIRRALISVYDKNGLTELAHGLAAVGVEIVSTGSTAALLRQRTIPVTTVSDLTGFPECLDGRVKTLHPRVHAGILADLRNPEHVAQLSELDIPSFDLVVVNLYPFQETAATASLSGLDADTVIEQIDIGGPALLRGAAKNHANVAVVVDSADYPAVLAAAAGDGFDLSARQHLAAKAFAHTAAYDVAVASWFGRELGADMGATGQVSWPPFVGLAMERAETLRYGENPHQSAALYVNREASPGIAQAEQLHGKPMSYNNYVDADAANRIVHDFEAPCVAIIKHTNPCGIAIAGADSADPLTDAYQKAHAGDPVSAFGGVIATNRTVSVGMAKRVAEIFTEVIIAPGYADGVVEILANRPGLRVLLAPSAARAEVELRPISGGMLAQTNDAIDASGDDPDQWRLVAGEAPDEETLADLAFAWRAVRGVKSNAILLAHDRASVGIGMGQVNRVDSARLAVSRAGSRAQGAVAASDAFFPFPDGLQILLDAGVRAVVQPGGSMRDEDVIAAAARANVPMYLTGARHFNH